MSDWNTSIIEEFHANQGKVASFAWADLLLLTTTGAKSGKPHTTPLVYFVDGDKLIICATMAGSPTNPAWYHNLVAHPEVQIELGQEKRKMKAHVLTGEERARLWTRAVERYPGFAEYQEKTTRQIPVIALSQG